MGITVRDAMKIGLFAQGTVVGGIEGLDRTVSYVDILEVPDIEHWLAEGVLLFTTGYAIQEKIETQLNLINLLHSNKAAGLVIKANRFLKEIPKEMIELANELKVPIISIPGHIPYVEITHPILEEILSSQVRMHLIKNRMEEIIDKSDLLPEKVTLDEINKIKNGLKMSSPYVVFLTPFESDSQLNRHVKMDQIEQSDRIIGFKSEGMFVCIMAINPINWKDTIYNMILSESSLDDKMLFCLTSGIINSFQELKYEYSMLRKNFNYLRNISPTGQKMICYDDVIHYVLIKEIIKDEKNMNLIKKMLKPIITLEKKEKELMIDTLYSYVSNGGNKTKAANESYVHRNTFYYRMDKLTKLLDSDLKSQEELYKYRLALDLYFIIKKNSKN